MEDRLPQNFAELQYFRKRKRKGKGKGKGKVGDKAIILYNRLAILGN